MINLNEEDKGQLRIILEAQADIGAKFHGMIANTLFKAYEESTNPAERLLFGLEIFCKSMQILEDLGLCCLTWLEAEKSGDPLGEFLNKGTGKIFQFYQRCAAGLTDQEIMVINCLPSAEQALAAGTITTAQVDEYRKKLSLACDGLRIVFKGFAAVYTEKPDGQIGDLKYGDILNMFFNVKHGVKILWANRPLSQTYFRAKGLPPTTIPILVGPRETPDGSTARRGLHFAGFDFTEGFIRRINENCFYISKTLSSMAQMRLDWLDHPGKSDFLEAPYGDLLKMVHESLDRSRVPEDEKAAIRKKWPLE